MKTKQTIWLAVVVLLAVSLNANATLVDLTTAGSSGGPVNGAFFVQDNFDLSTGTGVFEPFVRVQGNGTQEGYNTEGALEFQTKPGPWTHEIQLSEIPIVDGAYEFRLDINESANQPQLSIDAIKIHLADVGNLTDYGVNPAFGPALYDLDAGGDNTVLLDFSLGAGSGSGDMVMYIPVATLGVDGSKYLYLYSEFGVESASSDGFEEWGVLPAEIPEPATMLILGLGSVLLRKRK